MTSREEIWISRVMKKVYPIDFTIADSRIPLLPVSGVELRDRQFSREPGTRYMRSVTSRALPAIWQHPAHTHALNQGGPRRRDDNEHRAAIIHILLKLGRRLEKLSRTRFSWVMQLIIVDINRR